LNLKKKLGFHNLQEAYGEQNETVRADAAGEDFVEVPLQEEMLQHHHQRSQHWELFFEIGDQLGRADAVLHVEADVHLHFRLLLGQFNNRNLKATSKK
jgi:hypothetical protein